MSRPATDTLLRKGDPITIVYGARNIVLLTHVTRRNGDGEVIEVQLPRTTENLAVAGEGCEWVRGHHLIDSPAVDAARVAQGL